MRLALTFTVFHQFLFPWRLFHSFAAAGMCETVDCHISAIPCAYGNYVIYPCCPRIVLVASHSACSGQIAHVLSLLRVSDTYIFCLSSSCSLARPFSFVTWNLGKCKKIIHLECLILCCVCPAVVSSSSSCAGGFALAESPFGSLDLLVPSSFCFSPSRYCSL